MDESYFRRMRASRTAMKLVTFDAGRVGRLEGEGDDAVVVELDCASTREWFQCGGQAGETGERLPLAQVRLRAPIVPKKFFHTAGNFADHHQELRSEERRVGQECRSRW